MVEGPSLLEDRPSRAARIRPPRRSAPGPPPTGEVTAPVRAAGADDLPDRDGLRATMIAPWRSGYDCL